MIDIYLGARYKTLNSDIWKARQDLKALEVLKQSATDHGLVQKLPREFNVGEFLAIEDFDYRITSVNSPTRFCKKQKILRISSASRHHDDNGVNYWVRVSDNKGKRWMLQLPSTRYFWVKKDK